MSRVLREGKGWRRGSPGGAGGKFLRESVQLTCPFRKNFVENATNLDVKAFVRLPISLFIRVRSLSSLLQVQDQTVAQPNSDPAVSP